LKRLRKQGHAAKKNYDDGQTLGCGRWSDLASREQSDNAMVIGMICVGVY
jgi:hypothetical protein